MRKDLLTNKEWLKQKYINEGLSTQKIGNLCDCSSHTVIKYLNIFDIKIRSLEISHNLNARWNLLNNKEWLKQKYVTENLSSYEIAKICNCSGSTVRKYLKINNIKIKTMSNAKMSKNIKFELINNKDWLTNKYEKELLTVFEISILCNCSQGFIYNKLKKYNIRIKTQSESKRLRETFSGEKNPAWNGGISYLPYCSKFNKELKEEVRENFNRKCLICGREENGKKLSVHHIDYNKMQGCGHKWSLVPLCESCHTKTNYNRYYWFNLLNNYWLLNPETNFNSIIFVENRF